ncbi:hypothetical protein Esti_001443 [Eimeria stiedai]
MGPAPPWGGPAAPLRERLKSAARYLRSLLLPLLQLLPSQQQQERQLSHSSPSSSSSSSNNSSSNNSSSNNSSSNSSITSSSSGGSSVVRRVALWLLHAAGRACWGFFACVLSRCDRVLRLVGLLLPWLGLLLIGSVSAIYFSWVQPYFHCPFPPAPRLFHPLLLEDPAAAAAQQQQQQQQQRGWQQLGLSLLSPPTCVGVWLLLNALYHFLSAVLVAPGSPPLAADGCLSQQQLRVYAQLYSQFCGVSPVVAEPPACLPGDKDVNTAAAAAASAAAASPYAAAAAFPGKETDARGAPAATGYEPLPSLRQRQQQQHQQQQQQEYQECRGWASETELSLKKGRDDPSPFQVSPHPFSPIGVSSSSPPAAATPAPSPSTFLSSSSSSGKGGFARWVVCGKCGRLKGPRTRHCSACGVCVIRQDHHCPWINRCVGVRNLRCFVLLLLFATLLSLFGAVSFLPPAAVVANLRLIHVRRQQHAHSEALVFQTIAAGIRHMELQQLQRLQQQRAGNPAPHAQQASQQGGKEDTERLQERLLLQLQQQLLQQQGAAALPSGLIAKVVRLMLVLGVGSPPRPPAMPTQQQLDQAAQDAWRAAAAAAAAALDDETAAAANQQQHRQQQHQEGALSEEARRRVFAAGAAAARLSVAAAARALMGPPPFSSRVAAFAEAAAAADASRLRYLVVVSFCVTLNLGLGVFVLFVAHAFLILSNQTTLSFLTNLEAHGEAASGASSEKGEAAQERGSGVGFGAFLLHAFRCDRPTAFAPYNKGWRANVRQVLGPRPLELVFMPWKRTPQESLFC